MNQYLPHTAGDIDAMLASCGLKSLDDLYADVPAELRLKREYALDKGLSEQEVADFFEHLAAKNNVMPVCLAGNGFYDHYSPSVVAALASRSEFSTAYTPYQPEISQGTLQYIFEYQSMMASLTGLDISNASMYDATTAAAEAMMMCVAAARRRNRVLVSATLLPAMRAVLDTYARYHGVVIGEIAEEEGVTSLDDMKEQLAKGDVAGVILPQPNRHGIVEDLTGFADAIHGAKALMVMAGPASPLALLKTPGEWGADIAVGDGQSLGIPVSYGGPAIGYMTCRQSLMRKMPGRIVGVTNDARGNRVMVLTLQAREQHIRRNKATSNICSNQGLMSLYVTIYMALLGPDGLRRVNELSRDGAVYLADQLSATGRMRLAYPDKPFFNEFEMETDLDIDALRREAASRGILAGVKVAPNRLLLAVTERQSRSQLDEFVNIVKNL